MAWLAVNKNETEVIFHSKPIRFEKYWESNDDYVDLPSGSIEKLTGKQLTWEDEPIEI